MTRLTRQVTMKLVTTECRWLYDDDSFQPPTSRTCHQHISSPTSVTNIDPFPYLPFFQDSLKIMFFKFFWKFFHGKSRGQVFRNLCSPGRNFLFGLLKTPSWLTNREYIFATVFLLWSVLFMRISILYKERVAAWYLQVNFDIYSSSFRHIKS